MGWVVTALGLLLVAAALRDIFHTLWHPSGFGPIAMRVIRSVWRTRRHLRLLGPRPLAGPLGVVGAVGCWTALVVLGFVLVYWPHMPDGFHFGSSLRPEESSDPVAALYLSLVTVTTLGFGDVVPAEPALRLLAPLQALIGFILLTAAISWVLQVYPALGRRRAFSRRLSVLRSQDAARVVRTGDPAVVSRLLDSVTEGVVQVETDLVQYAESYYFGEPQPDLALAATLPYTLELVESGRRSSSPEVRLSAEVLAESVGILAGRLDAEYLRTGAAVPDVLAAYAVDQGHRPS